MADEEETELTTTTPTVEEVGKELIERARTAKSKEELDDIFNSIKKNNLIKDAMADDLLREIQAELLVQTRERVTNNPDEINNKEIIDFLNMTGNQIDKTTRRIEEINNIEPTQEETTIVIKSNLSRESRNNVIEAIERIQLYLNQKNNNEDNIVDAEFETESEKENEEENEQ